MNQNHSIKEEGKKSAMLKCPYCSCEFVALEDYEAHMKAFGPDRETHQRRFRELHSHLDRDRAED